MSSSMSDNKYDISTCVCGHCDLYHLLDSFKCVFHGCECTGFVVDCIEGPDEEIMAEAEVIHEETSVVGDPTEGGTEMDYGEYMLY